jgi:predicted phosphoribosyltransferase
MAVATEPMEHIGETKGIANHDHRTPEPFFAVGLWYEDFSQTTDEEVRDLLRRAAHGRDAAGQAMQGSAR